MFKSIVAFLFLGFSPLFCMEIDTECLPLNKKGDLIHEKWHEQDLAFIHASNNPLTTATAVGNCYDCMYAAIAYHKKQRLLTNFFCWRRSRYLDDVEHAAWNAASHSEKFGQFHFLLEAFPEVTHVIKIGRPILFHAISSWNVPTVDELLSYGADPNQLSTGEVVYAGCTPLMLAANRQIKSFHDVTRRERIIRLLLDHGAKVNVRHKKTEDTALLLAHNDKTISLLIDHGAYIDDQNTNGYTVLDRFFNGNIHQTNYPSFDGYSFFKKILVNGALRPIKQKEMCIHCEKKRCDVACRITNAFLLHQLVSKFSQAKIPKEVQLLILNYLPLSIHFCSVTALRIYGDMITPTLSEFAAARIPESIFVTVAQELPADKRSVFVHRVSQALMKRRLEVVNDLATKQVIDRHNQIGFFIKSVVPEYHTPNARDWPPPKLVDDIEKYYEEMFSRK